MKPLNPTDSMFLWMETRNQPMHVAGLNLYTPPPGAGPDYIHKLVVPWRGHLHATTPFDQRPVLKLGSGTGRTTRTGPDGAETFVLIRSVERREKERAMHARFSRRIDDGLARLGRRLQRTRRALDAHRLVRQLGRLLALNTRAAGRYLIELVPDATVPAGVRLEWSTRPEWDDWARWSEGCYVLRTNIADWSAEDLWRAYIQLTQAEAAFRIHKSDLSLRPIWHQKEDRVNAHILVCFLAYVLWKTLEQWKQRAELGQSPRTILEELRLRSEAAQAALLDRLGLELPERHRIARGLAQTPSNCRSWARSSTGKSRPASRCGRRPA